MRGPVEVLGLDQGAHLREHGWGEHGGADDGAFGVHIGGQRVLALTVVGFGLVWYGVETGGHGAVVSFRACKRPAAREVGAALWLVSLLVLPLVAVSGRCNGQMEWGGWKRCALVAFGAVVVLAVFAVLYGWLPWWIDGARLRDLSPKDQTGVLGSDRGDVLKMVAGAGALMALVYTARKHALDRKAHDLDRQAQELSRQVYALSEQGQVTDRYTKAITQLASDKLSERIGGIYALERIMADSERDHPTVVEVLAAFVRQRAPRLPAPVGGQEKEGSEVNPESTGLVHPDADVQAAMTVLARRPHRDEPFAIDLRRTALAGLELPSGARFARANFEGADLTGSDIRDATLTEAHLRGATLTDVILYRAKLDRARILEANLTNASLTWSSLTGAYLSKATIIKTDLDQAKLTGAHLDKANLTDASLYQATLNEANFYKAILTRTDLGRADLTGAEMLMPSQLAEALLDAETKLDEKLEQDAWVRARLEVCVEWGETEDPPPPPTPDPSRRRRSRATTTTG